MSNRDPWMNCYHFNHCLTFHVILNIWPILDSSMNWSRPCTELYVQKNNDKEITRRHTEVNTEAIKVSVYSFIYMLMWGEGQRLHESMIIKMRKKMDKRCVWMGNPSQK